MQAVRVFPGLGVWALLAFPARRVGFFGRPGPGSRVSGIGAVDIKTVGIGTVSLVGMCVLGPLGRLRGLAGQARLPGLLRPFLGHAVELLHDFQKLPVAADNLGIVLRDVGKEAMGAVLDAVPGIGEVAPALAAQGIERTVAEQAVEALRVRVGVTGKVLAFLVAVKGKVGAFPGKLGHE